jgi:hypothetical protein
LIAWPRSSFPLFGLHAEEGIQGFGHLVAPTLDHFDPGQTDRRLDHAAFRQLAEQVHLFTDGR